MKEVTKKVLTSILGWGSLAIVSGFLSIEYIRMGYRGQENDLHTRFYTAALVFLIVLLFISKMFISVHDSIKNDAEINPKRRRVSGFTFGIIYLLVVVVVNSIMKDSSVDGDALIVPYMFMPVIFGLIGVSISNASMRRSSTY